MSTLQERLCNAPASTPLLQASVDNLLQLLERSASPLVEASITELLDAEAWEELNDRFFKTLAFGTGGLRGRTIGKIVTQAEKGTPQDLGRPEFPCVGTNAMNRFNVARATRGLCDYLKEWFAAQGLPGKPRLSIAHDTRHFSHDFAELAARVASENGVDVVLFTQPRSTPQLSFTVRSTRSHAGIVITASHNPPHDNGYKVYFNDGAQVIEPHASGIIAKVNAVESDTYEPVAAQAQGTIDRVGPEHDAAYIARLKTLILDPEVIRAANDLKIVFTPIHGTGGVISIPILRELGFQVEVVAEQAGFDGRFPTVKSPNPENAEALRMALELADREGADLVMGTDPDSDRLGIAFRNAKGKMELLTGNQIGSLMAWYRVTTLLRQGVLNPENVHRAVIIKTLVTTDLQKTIAQRLGLRCVETLTGFKYIGAKLTRYEAALPETIRERYRDLSEEETRAARLEHSTFYVFGGEESYGYSGADFVRDKDANGAAVMFAEVAALAKSRGITLDVLLDEIYAEFGYYLERNESLTFEGAQGAAKIRQLVESYASAPSKELDGSPMKKITQFATETILDSEGEALPKEAMLMMELADGRRVAVRPSGTEPKIKFYFFGRRLPEEGQRLGAEELAAIKQEVAASLEHLWREIRADVDRRLA
ncbi:MAG TPA: phospho-sugar mutase [Chthoniobacteraceae bacterium]|nr:phospho-sugar mutase [Chthoniobacteraceae bacterium]